MNLQYTLLTFAQSFVFSFCEDSICLCYVPSGIIQGHFKLNF